MPIEISAVLKKDIFDYLSAGLTPLIAILASYIAFQQYRINKSRLRWELYDRRLKNYVCLKRFLSLILRDATVATGEALKFYSETSETEFLFGSDVLKLRDEIYKKAISLHANQLMQKNKAMTAKERTELVEKEAEIMEYYSEVITSSVGMFKPYMQA